MPTPEEKIAFLGDVHGEYLSLRWALEATRDCDRTICLGDIVGGTQYPQCLELLQRHGVEATMGNHDAWALRDGMCCSWLQRLPTEIHGKGWAACHSSYLRLPDGHLEWCELICPKDVLQALTQFSARVLLVGHTHIPAVNRFRNGGLDYVPTFRLRSEPLQNLHPNERYVINVGDVTRCVAVLYLDSAGPTSVEFRFTSKW